MADPLRHRQTKGAATDMVDLTPPRHIPTLPKADDRAPRRNPATVQHVDHTPNLPGSGSSLTLSGIGSPSTIRRADLCRSLNSPTTSKKGRKGDRPSFMSLVRADALILFSLLGEEAPVVRV